MSYHAISSASGDGGHVVELEETFSAAIEDVCDKQLEAEIMLDSVYLRALDQWSTKCKGLLSDESLKSKNNSHLWQCDRGHRMQVQLPWL
jgi:hypothetical protein